MLKEQEMNKGGTAEKDPYRSQGATTRTPTLAEVGITYSMPSRAQKINLARYEVEISDRQSYLS